AQLDAPEPPDHQHRDPIQPLPLYGLQYGAPGRPARLAIVIEAISLPDTVSPAIVGGRRIAVRGKKRHGFVHAGHRRRVSLETALLDVFLMRACRAEGFAHTPGL